MAEEKKYTETEYRKKVLEIIDWYCQVKNRCELRTPNIYKSHELRIFIANAKQIVPTELRAYPHRQALQVIIPQAK